MIEELYSTKNHSNRGGVKVDSQIDKLARTYKNECSLNG